MCKRLQPLRQYLPPIDASPPLPYSANGSTPEERECPSTKPRKSGTTENGLTGTTPPSTSSPTWSATAPRSSKAFAATTPSKAPPSSACASTCSASSTPRKFIAWSCPTRSTISAAPPPSSCASTSSTLATSSLSSSAATAKSV